MFQLRGIVEAILAGRDRGEDVSALLIEFERAVPNAEARGLLDGDFDADYIARRALAWRRVSEGPHKRAELLRLVHQIRSFEGGVLAVDIAGDALTASVAHPRVSEVVNDSKLSDEDVVEALLNYKPIQL